MRTTGRGSGQRWGSRMTFEHTAGQHLRHLARMRSDPVCIEGEVCAGRRLTLRWLLGLRSSAALAGLDSLDTVLWGRDGHREGRHATGKVSVRHGCGGNGWGWPLHLCWCSDHEEDEVAGR